MKPQTWWQQLHHLLEQISPVIVTPGERSLTIGVSRRFLLFRFMRSLIHRIEEDPYLNFIALLKNYKRWQTFLHGTIHELHRDRNRSYFKNFFPDGELYQLVREEIEWVYARNKKLNVTITKWGVIIFDNYRRNRFNTLLLTVHSGTWMPFDVARKQELAPNDRLLEEDVDTHKLYADLVLSKGGIWIDCKLSRFACDYNRSRDRAIYFNKSEEWVGNLWHEPLTRTQRQRLMRGYDEFYFALEQLVDSYRFNIIVDGHSMKDGRGRPDIGLGTHFLPSFYIPVVQRMRRQLTQGAYKDVAYNHPWSGGNILQWLNERFPDVFTLLMEINKKHYMTPDRTATIDKLVEGVASDITALFHLSDISGHKKKEDALKLP